MGILVKTFITRSIAVVKKIFIIRSPYIELNKNLVWAVGEIIYCHRMQKVKTMYKICVII